MYSFLGKGVFALILCLHILLKAYSKILFITNQPKNPSKRLSKGKDLKYLRRFPSLVS